MPHSGGGGSHSGGHSHSSSHSHSHSSGSGTPAVRISNHNFPGADRYVYYYNHRPHYYYGTGKYTPANRKVNGAFFMVFGLFWTLFSLIFMIGFFTIGGGALPLDYDTRIVIEDEAGLVNDVDSLITRLTEFQQLTGVTVAVVTRTPENAYIGNDCEIQSYNYYVENFDDESHWLIYYVGENPYRNDDWQWHLMCGDNCVRVLSTKEENRFTDVFHKYLLKSEDYTFDQCIIEALSQLKPMLDKQIIYADNVEVNGEYVSGQAAGLFPLLIISLFLVIGLVILIIGIIYLLTKNSEEVIAKGNSIKIAQNVAVEEKQCIYCGGTYIAGTVNRCPFCQAQIDTYSCY